MNHRIKKVTTPGLLSKWYLPAILKRPLVYFKDNDQKYS